MRASINTAWSTTDAFALVAGGRPLPDNGYLLVSLLAISVLMTIHGDVAIGAIGRALAAADAVIFDNDLFVPFAEDRIDRAAHQAIRVGAGATARRHQEVLEPQSFSHQSRFAPMRIGAGFGALIAAGA